MKHQGVIEAISHKYDKFAILFDGNWYNTKKEFAEEWAVKPSVGDEISWDDGGKKYLGKMKIVKKNTPDAPKSPAASAGSGGGYSSIGVEIGHASKLAMDMALQHRFEIASKDFYKFWAEETLKVHGMMTKLKAKASVPKEEPVKAEPEEEEVTVITAQKPEAEPTDELDDIF